MKRFLGLITAIGLAACTQMEMPTASDGALLYANNCAICHGKTGKGDGTIANDLDRKPSDLTRIAARRGGQFPVAEVLSTIDGYTRLEPQRQDMPEFGHLLEGELVPLDTGDGVMTPTPRPLVALVAYLENIQEG